MVQAKVASSWLAQILMDDSGGSTAFTSGFTQIKKKKKSLRPCDLDGDILGFFNLLKTKFFFFVFSANLQHCCSAFLSPLLVFREHE